MKKKKKHDNVTFNFESDRIPKKVKLARSTYDQGLEPIKFFCYDYLINFFFKLQIRFG